MNVLLIGVVILALVCMGVGYARGFIKIVVSLVATIITLVIVSMFAPQVGELLVEHTPLDEAIQRNFVKMFQVDEVPLDQVIASGVEIPLAQQIAMVEDSELPEFLKTALLNNNNNEIYNKLGVSRFQEYVTAYLANWIITVLAFIATFLVTLVIVRMAVFSLSVLADLPIIRGLDRIIGMGIGLLFALVIVWVGFLIPALAFYTEWGQLVFEMIEESKLLTFLYEENPILKALM